jgi:hypothetical protein
VIQLVFFLTVGGVLFVFLLLLARRGRAEGGAETLVSARQALFTLQTELLPAGLVGRIFAKDDLDFVDSEGSRQIRALFLKERQRIALLWVGRVRDQIRLLRSLHLGSARFYARLDLKTELALAADFGLLLVSCRALQLAFVVGGPYATPSMVGTVADAAARVCDISKQSLAFLTTPDLSALGDLSGPGQTSA